MSVRNHRGGEEKWVLGTVVKRLGPLTYLVRVGRELRYVHIEHLVKNKCMQVGDNVIPEEDNTFPLVPGSLNDSATRPLVPEASTTSDTTEPKQQEANSPEASGQLEKPSDAPTSSIPSGEV